MKQVSALQELTVENRKWMLGLLANLAPKRLCGSVEVRSYGNCRMKNFSLAACCLRPQRDNPFCILTGRSRHDQISTESLIRSR